MSWSGVITSSPRRDPLYEEPAGFTYVLCVHFERIHRRVHLGYAADKTPAAWIEADDLAFMNHLLADGDMSIVDSTPAAVRTICLRYEAEVHDLDPFLHQLALGEGWGGSHTIWEPIWDLVEAIHEDVIREVRTARATAAFAKACDHYTWLCRIARVWEEEEESPLSWEPTPLPQEDNPRPVWGPIVAYGERGPPRWGRERGPPPQTTPGGYGAPS